MHLDASQHFPAQSKPSTPSPKVKCEYVPVQNCSSVPKQRCDQRVTERPEEVCISVPVQRARQVRYKMQTLVYCMERWSLLCWQAGLSQRHPGGLQRDLPRGAHRGLRRRPSQNTNHQSVQLHAQVRETMICQRGKLDNSLSLSCQTDLWNGRSAKMSRCRLSERSVGRCRKWCQR